MDGMLDESYVKDDCQFCLGREGSLFTVSCWKGEDYQDNHWFVYFPSEMLARAEFDKWRTR